MKKKLLVISAITIVLYSSCYQKQFQITDEKNYVLEKRSDSIINNIESLKVLKSRLEHEVGILKSSNSAIKMQIDTYKKENNRITN